MRAPIAFGSSSEKYKWAGDARLINLMAERSPEGARERIAVIPAPGLEPFAIAAETPSRGVFFLPDTDAIYSVHAERLAKVSRSGVVTVLGAVAGAERCIAAQNRRSPAETVIVSEYAVYVLSDDEVRLVDIEAFDGLLPTSVAYLAGRIIYSMRDGRILWSDVGSAVAVQGLSFATAEDSSDKLKRVFVDRSELFLMGDETIEVWRPTGDADAPFAPVTNATIQKGIIGKHAVAAFDNSIAWVGNNGTVYRLESYVPKRISDHGVERLIGALDEAGRAALVCFTYSINGHELLHVTCPEWTKVYDAATAQWHDRQTLYAGGWRASDVVEAWGGLYAGDRLTGAVSRVDANSFSDLEKRIVGEMVSPVMHGFPAGMVINEAHLDLAVGYGEPLALDPIARVRWSNDGGQTFGDWRHVPIGKRGEYSTRAYIRRTGRLTQKGRVWHVAISDPIPRALVSMDIGKPEGLAT
jgi:hypothetical protein